MIGQHCNFQVINSTVEISLDIFRILVNYRLRHLVNNVAIDMLTL
jgi:transcriptional regulator of met regulon